MPPPALPPSSTGSSFLTAPPADAKELRGFPEIRLRRGTIIHRIHSAARGAWYFNADDTWRFNPVRLGGLGACYLAQRPIAGLLEIYKGVTMVDEKDVATKAEFTAELESELRLADCCAAAARGFGVNGEIHTTPDYSLTQAWAAALAEAGFDGVRYLCRSDPAMKLIGYAVWDTAGEAPQGRWPAGTDVPISDELIREAEAYGLHIRPTP